MNGFTRLRFVAAAVVVGTTVVIGCKGGGGGFAGRKNSETAARSSGPALGSPAKYAESRKKAPVLDSPESVAYHTSSSTTAPTRQISPQISCPVEGKS